MTEPRASAGRPALETGRRLGHYEIRQFVAAGGMSEVYAAYDTRLEREVALKVLPAEYGEDRNRLRRFEHEARAMCRLSHPNIVSVYDVGHEGTTPYIVTELLQGQTLRERLAGSRTTPRQAMLWAAQISRGLASAHANGIVHRDLKPANVFVTRDDHVKILDFGLAKLIHPEWEEVNAEENTISVVSRPGVIVGSIGYMSPEQVEGAAVDNRSDLFSLGAILYEMLTGVRAFKQGTAVETLHSILKDQPPDVRELVPDIDESLARIVRRCLAKNPDDRFSSAKDLAFSLEDLADRRSSLPRDIGTRRARLTISRSAALFAVAGLLLTAISAITSQIYSSIELPEVRIPARTRIQMTRVTTSGAVGTLVSLSPDGQYVAYDQVGDTSSIWLAHIPSGSSARILDGANVGRLRFSPDGNYIYYIGWNAETGSANLLRVPLLGGPDRIIARDVTQDTLTFSPDSAHVAYGRIDPGTKASLLVIATVDGRNERTVNALTNGKAVASCDWSPDGSRFLCREVFEDGHASIMVEVDAESGAITELPQMPFLATPTWAPDGRSVLGEDGAIVRAEYPSGVSETLTADLSEYLASNFSRDGRRVAAVKVDNVTNLWTMRVGDPRSLRQISTGINTYDGNQGVVTTPDGRIVFASSFAQKSTDLWICDADGGSRRRLTFDDEANERRADVSPDGRTVLYIRETGKREEDEAANIWTFTLDGSPPVQLTHHGGVRLPRFSADGSRIYYTRRVEGTDFIYEIPTTGGEPRRVSDTPAWAPSPSPDGKWLAVSAGVVELWPLSGQTEPRKLSFKSGGKQWRPDSSGFTILRGGNVHFYDLRKDRLQPVTDFGQGDPGVAWAHAWFPDGERLVFPRRSSVRDVVVIDLIR